MRSGPRLHAHELADVRGADLAQLQRLVLLPRADDHLVAAHQLRWQPVGVVLRRLRRYLSVGAWILLSRPG